MELQDLQELPTYLALRLNAIKTLNTIRSCTQQVRGVFQQKVTKAHVAYVHKVHYATSVNVIMSSATAAAAGAAVQPANAGANLAVNRHTKVSHQNHVQLLPASPDH